MQTKESYKRGGIAYCMQLSDLLHTVYASVYKLPYNDTCTIILVEHVHFHSTLQVKCR